MLVTSGPTVEPIDPVRFLSNRSSGKQGHAVASALASLGAQVTLVSGPVTLPDPAGVQVQHVQTAREMLKACEAALPVDVAVCVAAVADWRVKQPSRHKIKKTGGGVPVLELVENPDILKKLSRRKNNRPRLMVGFAAETDSLLENATVKRWAKGCDWIVASDVSTGQAFNAEDNKILLVTSRGPESWPRMSKQEIARQLAERIAKQLT